jgi:hypothetical protein
MDLGKKTARVRKRSCTICVTPCCALLAWRVRLLCVVAPGVHRTVVGAFGVLKAKWAILAEKIRGPVDTAMLIIQCCCAVWTYDVLRRCLSCANGCFSHQLHNWVLSRAPRNMDQPQLSEEEVLQGLPTDVIAQLGLVLGEDGYVAPEPAAPRGEDKRQRIAEAMWAAYKVVCDGDVDDDGADHGPRAKRPRKRTRAALVADAGDSQ